MGIWGARRGPQCLVYRDASQWLQREALQGVRAVGANSATIRLLMPRKTAHRRLDPIHPGTILREDLDDVGISINKLGRDLRVPVNRISEIVNGKRGITADTALRLARYFGTSAQYWLNLQSRYDLELAEAGSLKQIERDVRPLGKSA